MATVCIRMDKALYDSIVADLPAYQGDSDIYTWLPTQQAYTEGYVQNPPGEILHFFQFPYGLTPAATFTVNMFPNIFFTP